MIVLKFGGTSVNTKEKIETICHIVQKESKKTPLLVVSAIRGITDELLSLLTKTEKEQQSSLEKIQRIHQQLAKDFFGTVPLKFIQLLHTTKKELTILLHSSKKTNALQDKIVSYGEVLSSYLISQALQSKQINAVSVISTTFLVTNNNFGNADFFPKKTKEKIQKVLTPLLLTSTVPVITGFIGATEKGETTTLGRGGSDYSASIIASCLRVREIQFWKDVNGIYSEDPRVSNSAAFLDSLSYSQIIDLLNAGATILHQRTIHPLYKLRIPIRILNTMYPENIGTIIREK
jgi:aspartate kinase